MATIPVDVAHILNISHVFDVVFIMIMGMATTPVDVAHILKISHAFDGHVILGLLVGDLVCTHGPNYLQFLSARPSEKG